MNKQITISKEEYEDMKNEIKTLKNTNLYKKVLKANKDMNEKLYTRKDIGF